MGESERVKSMLSQFERECFGAEKISVLKRREAALECPVKSSVDSL